MKTLGENGGDEAFVRLIQIAQDDPVIHTQLLAILSMEPFDRESALNTLIEKSRLSGAQEDFIIGLSVLLNHQAADKALGLLKANTVKPE